MLNNPNHLLTDLDGENSQASTNFNNNLETNLMIRKGSQDSYQPPSFNNGYDPLRSLSPIPQIREPIKALTSLDFIAVQKSNLVKMNNKELDNHQNNVFMRRQPSIVTPLGTFTDQIHILKQQQQAMINDLKSQLGPSFKGSYEQFTKEQATQLMRIFSISFEEEIHKTQSLERLQKLLLQGGNKKEKFGTKDIMNDIEKTFSRVIDDSFLSFQNLESDNIAWTNYNKRTQTLAKLFCFGFKQAIWLINSFDKHKSVELSIEEEEKQILLEAAKDVPDTVESLRKQLQQSVQTVENSRKHIQELDIAVKEREDLLKQVREKYENLKFSILDFLGQDTQIPVENSIIMERLRKTQQKDTQVQNLLAKYQLTEIESIRKCLETHNSIIQPLKLLMNSDFAAYEEAIAKCFSKKLEKAQKAETIAKNKLKKLDKEHLALQTHASTFCKFYGSESSKLAANMEQITKIAKDTLAAFGIMQSYIPQLEQSAKVPIDISEDDSLSQIGVPNNQMQIEDARSEVSHSTVSTVNAPQSKKNPNKKVKLSGNNNGK